MSKVKKDKSAREYADEILKDKKPYALKIAKELRKAEGNRVLLDQAAQCLEDDCDYLKKIAESIKASQCDNAKLREVVELLARVFLPPKEEYPAEYGGGKVPDDEWLAWLRPMQARARAALSSPARNCDIYSESRTATKFDAIYKGPRDGVCIAKTKRERNIHTYYIKLIKWLFAKAKMEANDFEKMREADKAHAMMRAINKGLVALTTTEK